MSKDYITTCGKYLYAYCEIICIEFELTGSSDVVSDILPGDALLGSLS
jgi:hypothetical protein